MLRPKRSADYDIVVLHVAPSRPDSIFRRDLQALHDAGAIRLVARYDDEHGLLDLDRLTELVPDLGARTTFGCGPSGLLDALAAHHDRAGLKLFTEQFRTTRLAAPGEGGTVSFASNDTVVEAAGDTPILDAAEAAGVLMPSGCRMGICYGCVLPAQGRQRARPAHRRRHHRRPRRRPRHQDPDLHPRRGRRLPPRPLTRPSIS